MALQQCKFLVFGPLLSGLAAALPPPEHEGEDRVQEVEAASSEPQHVDRGEGGVRSEACSSDVVHYITVQYSTVQYSTVQYSTVQYSLYLSRCGRDSRAP